jgi:hypothetical protein
MHNFYKLLLLIFILPLFSSAQSNYKPGYVVNLKGDTIKGFIDYREWLTNPNSINFKTTLADKIQKQSTGDIIAFTVSGLESYQLYAGSITMDSTDPNHISEGRDSSRKDVSVFLKVLQKGPRLALYTYVDDIKTRFFVQESTDKAPVELIFRTYFDMSNVDRESNKGRTINESAYLNQLYALAQKYGAVTDSFQWDIEHGNYDEHFILKTVTEINGISKTQFKQQNTNAKSIRLFAGLALNSTTTKPASEYLVAGGKTHTSNLPAVSFGVNFLANPNTGKLIFRVELGISENQYRSDYNNLVEPYIPVRYTFNQLNIALEPQIIYNFYNADNFKIFAGFGFALTYYKYSNASFASQDGTVSGPDITQDNPYFFNTYNTLAMLKAGVQFNNLALFADYITASALSPEAYFQMNTTTVQVGVNYFFK